MMILVHKRNIAAVFGPRIERLVDGTNCLAVHFSNPTDETSGTCVTKVKRNEASKAVVNTDALKLSKVVQAAVMAGRVVTVMYTSGDETYYVGGLFQQEIDLSLKY